MAKKINIMDLSGKRVPKRPRINHANFSTDDGIILTFNDHTFQKDINNDTEEITTSFSGGNVAGLTIFESGLSSNSISGNTFYSGNTNISNIFSTQNVTNLLQSQINTKLNISGGTATGGITAPLFSGGSFIGNGANLNGIITGITFNPDTLYLTAGINNANPISVNLASLTVGHDNYITGGIYNPSTGVISFTTFSGTSFDVSGFVTGFTQQYQTLGLNGYNLNILSGNSISLLPITSANTNDIQSLSGTLISLQNQEITKLNKSGDTMSGQLTTPSLFSTTLSATTIFSGSTPLSTIISGLDTYVTGATLIGTVLHLNENQNKNSITLDLNPLISANTQNVTSLSGSLSSYTQLLTFNSYTGTNDTNISSLQTQLNNKLNLSGGTITGSLSANTFYSGSTSLTSIIQGLDTYITGMTINSNIIQLNQNNQGNNFVINLSGLTSGLTTNTTFNAYTAATNSSLSTLQSLLNAIPTWIKITKSYSDFTTAGLSNTINIYQPTAKQVVHAAAILPTVAFNGGLIATYTLSLGVFSNIDLIPASTVFTVPTKPFINNAILAVQTVSPSQITATAISTVGNLNAATQGSVDIFLYVSTLP